MLNPSEPTDNRNLYDWKTHYPEALKEIYMEAAYLVFLLIISYIIIFMTFKGHIFQILSIPADQAPTFKKYIYYSMAGMLGGVAFDMKFLYRSVARGFWNQDRRLWRLLSPFVALTIAFVVGAMIDASFLATKEPVSSATFIVIGFLAGYFADHAVGKLYEIARAVFGENGVMKDGDGK
jgi:hypothetical protein